MKPALHAAALLLFAAQITATAEEKKRTPLKEFEGKTYYHLMACKIEAQTAFAEVELGKISNAYDPIRACAADAKAKVKQAFSPALAQVAKKPESAKLLKEYYAQWMTLLDGVAPDGNERKMVYERRQGEAKRKLDEHWNRFAIEAGL